MNIPPFITRHRFSFALTAIIAAYLAFGLHHIGQFITADEHYWVEERIPQYWDAITNQNWKKTFINDKPGVTLALVSGVGLLSEPHPEKHSSENQDRTLAYDINSTESLYTIFRLPILIINGLLLIYLFWIIGRVAGPWVALWTTAFSALSPILLGISQIINPDSLLWSIGGAAIFSYLAFLKIGEKRYFWLTAIFLGFALLAKYAAFILLPFFLILIVSRFLFDGHITDIHELSARLKRDFLAWTGIATISIALLCLFLPALLIDSKYAFGLFATVHNKTAFAAVAVTFLSLFLIDTFAFGNKLLLLLRRSLARLRFAHMLLPAIFFAVFIGLIAVRHLFPEWSIFAIIPFDIKDLSDARYVTDIPNFSEAFIMEWNPLVFSFTPIMLLGCLILFAAMMRKRGGECRFPAQSLLFLAFAYSILLILSNVLATPRYSILLYPVFAFLAALGIQEACHTLGRFPKVPTKTLATAIIFLGSIASLSAIKPFYFNYANALLPEDALIHDAWGYGGYEAAQYLNSLPDAEHLTIWSDYYGVCEFFVGRCLTAYTFDPAIIQPDYYVLTRRGKIRYMSRADRWERLSGLTAYRYYDISDPAWQLWVDSRPGNFIKIVKLP